MAKLDLVAQKIATARVRLKAADEFFTRPVEEFLDNEGDRDLATFYLFLAIQECIDIAAHWVADAGWGAPEDAGGAFEILTDKGVIDRELARGLRGATGLRNRIAHGYMSIEPERMHAEYQKGTEIMRRFLAAVADSAGM
jgi:uncharacterized protein YutE (UPF0331/DUF86 family)